MATTELIDRWPAPDRDSPGALTFNAGVETDEHLALMLKMDGEDGLSDTRVEQVTGVAMPRARRWHKIFERMGVLYSSGNVTHLTDLGLRLREADSIGTKELRRSVARDVTAVLKKFQLNNPVDRPAAGDFPSDCDIHPYWAIWKAADELDGRLHWDELTRELMWVLRHSELGTAIDRIRAARREPGYDPVQGGTTAFPLRERAYDQDSAPEGKVPDGQIRDQKTTPWFKRAGFGGLLMHSPGAGGGGYWTIPDELRDIIHNAVIDPPQFKNFTTPEEWFAYYGAISNHSPDIERQPTSLDLEEIKAGIRSRGGTYTDKVLQQFHSGLNFLGDKHFVILKGISGTGKTSLALRYAYTVHGIASLRDPNPFFFMCPVRPDWTDPSGLSGHFDVFAQKYVVPTFLKAVLTANTHPTTPTFLCLDEMNIARVEYYFSEALSCMETGLPLTIHSNATSLAGDTGDMIPPRIEWPRNLYIVGTINVDDTTHPLSHKVLDRAVVVDMSDVDVGGYLDSLASTDPDKLWSIGKSRDVITGVYRCLAVHGQGFGYRTIKECVAYHKFMASDSDEPSSMSAIDDQLVQKLLVKIRGTESQRSMLTQLSQIVTDYPQASRLLATMLNELQEFGSFQATR